MYEIQKTLKRENLYMHTRNIRISPSCSTYRKSTVGFIPIKNFFKLVHLQEEYCRFHPPKGGPFYYSLLLFVQETMQREKMAKRERAPKRTKHRKPPRRESSPSGYETLLTPLN